MTDIDTSGAGGEPPPGRGGPAASGGTDEDARHPARRLRRALSATARPPAASSDRQGGGEGQPDPPDEDFAGVPTRERSFRITRRGAATGMALAILVGAAAFSLAPWSGTRHPTVAATPAPQAVTLPLPPQLRPSARDDAAMAYDPTGGEVVLFGGLVIGSEGLSTLSDTWSWDGTRWSQLDPATSPPGLSGALLGYDPSSRRLVLTGGDISTGGNRLEESGLTWTWDGSTWSPQPAGGLPSSDAPTALATDDATGQLILVTTREGCQGTDTWRWGGAAWVLLHPAASPPPAAAASLAYDPRAGTLDLFTAAGGCDATGATAATPPVWSWTGSTWTAGATPPAPVLSGAWEVTTSGGGALVVTSQGTYLWRSQPGGLSEVSSSPVVGDSAVTYDAGDGQVVLFGGMCAGCGGDAVPDTWTWDGSWTLRDTTAAGTPRATT